MFIHRPGRRRGERGFTFIELIMFIVIVSVGIAGILLVLNVTVFSSADPQQRKQAQAIAEALMEEVQGARFTFCEPTDATAEQANNATVGAGNCTATVENAGPEAGNVRPFDNVNDYVTDFGTATTYTTDAMGQPYPAGYTATITIDAAPLNGIASNAASPVNTNVLRIRVAVAFGSNEIVLDGYRTRYAPRWIP